MVVSAAIVPRFRVVAAVVTWLRVNPAVIAGIVIRTVVRARAVGPHTASHGRRHRLNSGLAAARRVDHAQA